MTRVKKTALIALPLLLLVFIAFTLLRSTTPESRFRSRFTDLSTGIPEYQSLTSFTQPADAIQGDHFTAELIQTESQLHQFATALGTTPQTILSTNGTSVKADSALNPKHPWILHLRATPSTQNYKVHIEGRQPYD
ncbi:MAG TPA: hypothetical protein VGH19_08340 [Verrucomicrobiae bacterium]